MRYLFLLTLLITFSSQAQIWKQPFDTLPYIDGFERLSGDQLGIKSYSVTKYLDTDSIVSYDYNGFNKEGYLTKQFYAMYPGQHTDTNFYHYENGIVQGDDTKREHIYNEQQRLIEIRASRNDSTWSTHLIYEDDKLMEIRYSDQYWTTFQYDLNGELLRKEIFQKGKLKEYFNYEHPNEKTLVYQDCLLNDKGIPYLPCGVTEGYFDDEDRLVKIVTKFDLDSSSIFITEFQYDQKGKLMKMTDVALHDPELGGEAIYIRNEKGLLTKVEHYRKGKLSFYFQFDYEFY